MGLDEKVVPNLPLKKGGSGEHRTLKRGSKTPGNKAERKAGQEGEWEKRRDSNLWVNAKF